MLHVFVVLGRFVFLFIHEGVEQEGAAVDGFGFSGRGWEGLHGTGLRV
jgi:hypothetical protein